MTVTEASILLVLLLLAAFGFKAEKMKKDEEIDPDLNLTESMFFDCIIAEDVEHVNSTLLYEYRRKQLRLKAAMLTAGYTGDDYENLLTLIKRGRVDKQKYLNFRMKLANEVTALQQRLAAETQKKEEEVLAEAYKKMFEEE